MACVLDASAILNNPSFYFGLGKYLICSSALSEIKEDRARALVNEALGRGSLELKEPVPETVKKVEEKAVKIGEKLSKADIDTLALALDTGEELITDDYGMQNLAGFLGIKYAGALLGKIREKVVWSLRCSKCGKRQDEGRVCRLCGGKLVRKALRKEPEDSASENHKNNNPD